MNKNGVISQLENAVEKAANLAIKNSMPIPGRKGTFVGKTIVEQTPAGLFNVKTLDNRLLYKDIYTADIAIIVAQRYNLSEFNTINRILEIESQYSKYSIDMIYYVNCYKHAKRRQDYEKMYVLEDKYKIAKARAKNLKNSLAVFKK